MNYFLGVMKKQQKSISGDAVCEVGEGEGWTYALCKANQ